MSIKIVKIISGEDLVGDWSEKESIISNPVVMVPVSKDQLGFTPWIPLAEEKEIKLKEQHILTIATPDDKLQNEYNRMFGSGIIVPDDNIIH
tara:strand:+ start:290 stop:565 length:276 start_codon:yes stop_codon:yes gene_type:complete